MIMGWWTISGEALMDALEQAHDGTDPSVVYAEFYANSDVSKPSDDEPPAVTDAEVEAATLWLLRNIDMLEPDPRDVDTEAIREQVRGALEAAAEVRP